MFLVELEKDSPDMMKMNKKLRYHDPKLEKLSEKATIENVDDHSELILQVFFSSISLFFVGCFRITIVCDIFLTIGDWMAQFGRRNNGSLGSKMYLCLT